LVRTPNVAEYQVRQTDNGIDVAVIAEGVLDQGALAASLERMLRSAGVSDPRVHVHEVAAIPRLPHSGKTRRFIPMNTAPLSAVVLDDPQPRRTADSVRPQLAGRPLVVMAWVM
jgi:hypothetical protein